MERLEPRLAMAATMQGGTLTITGTSGPDYIEVTEVRDSLRVDVNGQVQYFDRNEPLFDEAGYLSRNEDVRRLWPGTALEHWALYGHPEGRPGEFDAALYLSTARDVAAVGMDAVEHFIRFGFREDRHKLIEFDAGYYLETQPDVAAAVARGAIPDAFTHFWHWGRFEARAYFDPAAPEISKLVIEAGAGNDVVHVHDHERAIDNVGIFLEAGDDYGHGGIGDGLFDGGDGNDTMEDDAGPPSEFQGGLGLDRAIGRRGDSFDGVEVPVQYDPTRAPFEIQDGVLYLTGTDRADWMYVATYPDSPNLHVSYAMGGGMLQHFEVSLNSYTHIAARGWGGDDYISVYHVNGVTYLDGGDGADELTGSPYGYNFLRGGRGPDSLNDPSRYGGDLGGGPGADVLYVTPLTQLRIVEPHDSVFIQDYGMM